MTDIVGTISGVVIAAIVLVCFGLYICYWYFTSFIVPGRQNKQLRELKLFIQLSQDKLIGEMRQRRDITERQIERHAQEFQEEFSGPDAFVFDGKFWQYRGHKERPQHIFTFNEQIITFSHHLTFDPRTIESSIKTLLTANPDVDLIRYQTSYHFTLIRQDRPTPISQPEKENEKGHYV